MVVPGPRRDVVEKRLFFCFFYAPGPVGPTGGALQSQLSMKASFAFDSTDLHFSESDT
jgi:hypothetical protein